jgi:hypothetical protein
LLIGEWTDLLAVDIDDADQFFVLEHWDADNGAITAALDPALKADKSVPEAEKKEGLAQLEAALKNAKPVQFKQNIALVLKYFDKLAPLMQEQDSELRPAD